MAYLAPKNSESKNLLEKLSSRFFGIKTASFSLIIFQRSKLSTRSFTHLCWSGAFEGKTPQGGHQGGLVLARQRPGSPGSCKPEETGLPGLPVSLSPTLFSGSGPIGLPPVPWTEKRSPVFVRHGGYCCPRDLVGRTTFRFFFLSGLQMLAEWAKKFIELCGECVE